MSRPKSILLTTTLLLVLASPQAARGDAEKALALVPAESYAVAVASNWKTLNAKFNMVAQQLGLVDLLGDKMTPLLAGRIGLNVDALDANQAVVMTVPRLPAEEGVMPGLVLMVPVTDYAAFVKANQGSVEKGTLVAEKLGDFRVKQVGVYACISDSPEHLAAIGAPAKPFIDSLSARQKQLLGESDLLLHVRLSAVVKVMGPRLDKERRGPIGEDARVRTALEFLAELGPDIESLTAGAKVDRVGALLRVLVTPRADSALAGLMSAVKPAAGPIITRVPLENYLLAWGSVALQPGGDFTGRVRNAAVKLLGGLTESVDRVVVISDHADKLMRLVKSWSLSVTAGPELKLPLVINEVAEVSDGPAALAEARHYLNKIDELVNEKTQPQTQPDEPVPAPLLAFTPEAETIDGVKVDHWRINVSRLSKLGKGRGAMVRLALYTSDDDPDLRTNDQGEKLPGSIVARMGLVDGRFLVMTTGGSKSAFAAALKALRAGTNLSGDAGVGRVAKYLGDKRAVELYVAADRAANVGLNLLHILLNRQQKFPVFREVNRPVAAAVRFEGGTAEVRVFVPTALLVARQGFMDEAHKQEQEAEKRSGGGS